MLRISVDQSANPKTIRLEGRIAGPWVEVFSQTWQHLATSSSPVSVRVDLRDVAFIDSRGRELLRRIHEQSQVTFVSNSPLTQYFAEDAMRHSVKNEQEEVA